MTRWTLLLFIAAVATAARWTVIPSATESAVAIEGLDLSRIQKRVAKEQQWSSEQTARAALEYRRFLHLLTRHGDSTRVVPSAEVDQMWHAHILFTEQYTADCQRIFGHYMHHAPSDDSDTARAEDKQDYQQTLRLYRDLFGSEPGRSWVEESRDGSAGACGGGGCGASCSGSGNKTAAVMCPMAMFFGAQVETCLWLESWHVTKGWQYALSVFAILGICMFREWLTVFRQKQHAKKRSQDSKDAALLPEGNQVNSSGQATTPPTAREVLVGSTFYAINVTLAYLIMLLVMTYNVGVCIAVIFGLFLGNFLFTYLYSRRSVIKPAEADHCCEGADGS